MIARAYKKITIFMSIIFANNYLRKQLIFTTIFNNYFFSNQSYSNQKLCI